MLFTWSCQCKNLSIFIQLPEFHWISFTAFVLSFSETFCVAKSLIFGRCYQHSFSLFKAKEFMLWLKTLWVFFFAGLFDLVLKFHTKNFWEPVLGQSRLNFPRKFVMQYFGTNIFPRVQWLRNWRLWLVGSCVHRIHYKFVPSETSSA